MSLSALLAKISGRTNSPPIRVLSAAAPAIQVLEFVETGPRVNEAGEMLTVFPPTSIEMGVSNSQGTRVLKIHKYVSTE
jgi:hypothetical protein